MQRRCIRVVPTMFSSCCGFPCQLRLAVTQLPLSPDTATSGLSPSQIGPCTGGPSVFDTCTPLRRERLRHGEIDKRLCPIFIEAALRQPNPPLHCLLISLCLTRVASLSLAPSLSLSLSLTSEVFFLFFSAYLVAWGQFSVQSVQFLFSSWIITSQCPVIVNWHSK